MITWIRKLVLSGILHSKSELSQSKDNISRDIFRDEYSVHGTFHSCCSDFRWKNFERAYNVTYICKETAKYSILLLQSSDDNYLNLKVHFCRSNILQIFLHKWPGVCGPWKDMVSDETHHSILQGSVKSGSGSFAQSVKMFCMFKLDEIWQWSNQLPLAPWNQQLHPILNIRSTMAIITSMATRLELPLKWFQVNNVVDVYEMNFKQPFQISSSLFR